MHRAYVEHILFEEDLTIDRDVGHVLNVFSRHFDVQDVQNRIDEKNVESI